MFLFDALTESETVDESVNGAMSALFAPGGPGAFGTTEIGVPLIDIDTVSGLFSTRTFIAFGTIADLNSFPIQLVFDNKGADFNGGDPVNYLDLIVSYSLVKTS